ncbi:MAG: CPBP family intramembrane glutamic endopeptidase [Promethearchaeota archaeon]
MVSRVYYGKKKIAVDRLRFFLYEVAFIFIFVFLLLIIPLFAVPLFVDKESVLYGILIYGLRALFIFIGIPLILYLSNLIFESQKQQIIIKEDISPSIGHLRLFKMTKKNYKYQILYGLLIFFLVFLPIDFLGYLLIPEMIEYQALAFSLKNTNIYLTSNDYYIFLISAIIIQVSVAIAEESISRGLIAKRGSEYFFKMSAVIISSLYFGLGHFAYFLDLRTIEILSGKSFPLWYPLVWFVQAFIVGIILSLFILRKKWIFPAIIAHALNNIVSAHTIWSFIQGNDFTFVALYLYYPLLVIGFVLLVWQFPKIKDGVNTGFQIFKTYFIEDETSEKTKGDKYFRYFIDIIMSILIFLMSMMVAI